MDTHDTSDHRALFRRMADPDFYPHPAAPVTSVETHISKVFLAGDYVYKIKKPLNLGFLDFTTLEKRAYFCDREIFLNRRLAADVYLDVVAITCQNGTYRLGGEGPAVEYAVKMRRLADTCAMKYLLRSGRIDNPQIQDLAQKLAAFYGQPAGDPLQDRQAEFDIIAGNCAENFNQTRNYTGRLLDPDLFSSVQDLTMDFLQQHRLLFFNRMDENRFQDCHGDLRTGHVYFTDRGIRIIDCIEFNDRFRHQDVASDLGFLAMDMEFMGYRQLAATLISACARVTRDPGIYGMIDFYKSYRAVVRLKVDCIRHDEPDVTETVKDKLAVKIKRHLMLARHYARCASRPRLWVVCGMPASGKSTLARELGGLCMARVISSDRVRREMFGPASETAENIAFETDIYSRDATRGTYDKMLETAAWEIRKGGSVILDATFSARVFRRQVVRLAETTDAGLLFIECVLPDARLKKRLKDRETQAVESDARLTHFEFFKKNYEPLTEISEPGHIEVNTENSIQACVDAVLSGNYRNTQPDES